MKNAIALIAILINQLAFAQVQNWIAIPATLSGSEIDLDFHVDSVQMFPGIKTQTLSFNQYAYLGPTIILNKGEDVQINVENNMDDTTNIHWHGLHVSPENDGGPHTMVMQGDTWSPQFTVLNEAGTYWYHPHFHGKTGAQVLRGASGFIIVRDQNESALSLPRSYGVDDFPIVVQSIQYDNMNQPMPLGMQDSTIFVNGSRANYGHEANLNIPAQMVRFRLLNGSGERTFNFGFTNNMSFKIIASDGGLLNAPVNATRIRIAPGERYEIVVDASDMEGESFELMSYASELETGIQGGPTMDMGGQGPPMDSPTNGIDFDILSLHVIAPTPDAVTSISSNLNSLSPFVENTANFTRNITMNAPNAMSMDGPFTFNGESFDMEVINHEIPLNNIEIWEVTNQTMVAHPFHIHDVPFYILDRDGNIPPVYERGKKDVVLVKSMETVRFITKFETFSDTITPYVYHCHILMHEDDGMMGQFIVSPTSTNVSNEDDLSSLISVYPNPSHSLLTINFPSTIDNGLYQLSNAIGEVCLQNVLTPNKIDISTLAPGVYTLKLTLDQKTYTYKIIKQ
jgi:blue copper oxidase